MLVIICFHCPFIKQLRHVAFICFEYLHRCWVTESFFYRHVKVLRRRNPIEVFLNPLWTHWLFMQVTFYPVVPESRIAQRISVTHLIPSVWRGVETNCPPPPPNTHRWGTLHHYRRGVMFVLLASRLRFSSRSSRFTRHTIEKHSRPPASKRKRCLYPYLWFRSASKLAKLVVSTNHLLSGFTSKTMFLFGYKMFRIVLFTLVINRLSIFVQPNKWKRIKLNKAEMCSRIAHETMITSRWASRALSHIPRVCPLGIMNGFLLQSVQ